MQRISFKKMDLLMKMSLSGLCVFVAFGCQNKLQSSVVESSFSSMQSGLVIQPDTGLALDMGLKLTLPDTNRGKIKIEVAHMDNVSSIRMLVGAEDVGKINRIPFEYYYDGTQSKVAETIVRVTAKNLNGQTFSIEQKIMNNAGTESGSSPTNDPNCKTNPSFDACLFYKNPVAQAKAPIPSGVSFGRDLSTIQTFGVKLRNLTNPNQLKNSFIDVYATNGVRAAPVSGKWNFEYKNDANNHAVAQVMAFYWLNEQAEYMKTNSGAFYAENRGIRVDAYRASIVNNAYWDGSNIVMGRFSAQESALSAEIYLHEMGHANLDFATNSRINISSAYCDTAMGCIGAIHEGMADIHSVIMFPEDPTMAQTITNSLAGWTSRDVRRFNGRNVDYFFSMSQGEVHGMGTAYAVILYQIMKDPVMLRVDFEKIFSMHLTRLTSNSDFKSAKTILMNISDTQFSGKYTAVIKRVFEGMGVL